MSGGSLAEALATLPAEERNELLSRYGPGATEALRWCWRFFARPDQLAPDGQWRTWLILAGRGFGKTRSICEWARSHSEPSVRATRGAIVGRTAADVRDILIEGESGILACSPTNNRPLYEPSKRRITWKNGTVATCYSADEPDLLRGPQHHWAIVDELAAWKHAQDAWDMLMMGLRLGNDPRVVIATTPRPIQLIRNITKEPTTRVTRGSTYANRANLAPAFLDQILSKYEGTTLGRQELYAELLDEAPGALWRRALIEQHRVSVAPTLTRIVVAIDPAATSGKSSDDTGIVVAGKGADGQCYILADRTCHKSPEGWAREAVKAFDEFKADRIVAETNHGGEMVTATLRTVDSTVPVQTVTASRGKAIRAEPVSALAEQGRLHHVGSFPALEDQLVTWTPDSAESPDRLDAMVWAVTELMLSKQIWVI